MSNRPFAICLTAPTASGKTELSLWLAEHLPIEVISMDSAMVYRGLDIGTAKPTLQQRMRVPHHLIDVCDPAESYSAGQFVADAALHATVIAERGHVPLIVGGTMMYLRALRQGIAQLPRADAQLRAKLDAEALEAGWPQMHARLAQIDPVAAQRIAVADRQRIQRALEVFELTGTPLTALLERAAAQVPLRIFTIAVMSEDREMLRERIAQRFDDMLQQGFVDEVAALRARSDLHANLPALRSVGYRQIWSHLSGACTLAQARDDAITATRRLAKRQRTWLRSDPVDLCVRAEDVSVRDAVLSRIREMLPGSH